MRTLSVLVTVALLAFTGQAHAQFGNAGAVESSGNYTPGVDMPLFGVYNLVNRDADASSDIDLLTTRSSISRIYAENVAPSSTTGPQNTEIGNSFMEPANLGVDPWPSVWPSTNPGAPAYTNTRFTRVFGREVYNDMALIWNYPPFVQTTSLTSYDLYIQVSWPAGVGQAFGTPYPAGSTKLKIRYNAR